MDDRTRPAENLRKEQGGRPFLMVLVGGQTSIIQLPANETYVVGRASDVEVPVDDLSMSRRHAAITMTEGRAVLSDLGSSNGTCLNGQQIEEPTELTAGDVISLGVTQIIFQRTTNAPRPEILEWRLFEQRLHAEVERSMGSAQPQCLVLLRMAAPCADPGLGKAVPEALRTIDVLGQLDERTLAVLLPELAAAEGRYTAMRLLQTVRRFDAEATAGLASWPDDAADGATLLAAAQAALEHGKDAGGLGTAQDSVTNVRVGSHRVSFADPAMLRVFALAKRLAAFDLPILICGETGVGKEVFASAIHHFSKRAKGPYVTINCAALPETLAESELFGTIRGAYTGADAARAGKLETASGGTIFFDEVGELPLSIQAKLLRALEEKKIVRLGDSHGRDVDIRIVAATNRDMKREVADGRFRSDLFYRLSVGSLTVPPLRARPREISVLARQMLKQLCERAGVQPLELAPDAIRLLLAHNWPGNVRELRNVLERSLPMATGTRLEGWMLPQDLGGAGTHEPPVEAPFHSFEDEIRDYERRRMEEALRESGGVQTRAAVLLKMPLRTFQMRIKQYGIDSTLFKPKA